MLRMAVLLMAGAAPAQALDAEYCGQFYGVFQQAYEWARDQGQLPCLNTVTKLVDEEAAALRGNMADGAPSKVKNILVRACIDGADDRDLLTRTEFEREAC